MEIGNTVKVADAKHIKIMCNVLIESNTKHTACTISLIYSVLKACSTLKANCQLQHAKDLIKNLSIVLVKIIYELAYELYTFRSKDVKTNFDKNHAEIEKASHAQNSGSSKTEICFSQVDDDFQATTSHLSD
ncbi:unnamed protein product [Wuchereria bancrofti]|uniref:Uncharacterized protein n=1 Tax=Wuchereria bancrofti TaxID=6293 RepID=A0A3P7DR93_WUCBA|nr:unnamed protein product [Wuchereria bancrofti]